MATAYVNSAALDDWRSTAQSHGLFSDLGGLQQVPSTGGGNKVGLADFVSALEKFGFNIKQPGVAWSVGLSADYFRRGIVGKAVLGSPTLGCALHRLAKYYPLIQDRTHVGLSVRDESAVLSYQILDPDIWPRHTDALYTLGIFAALLQEADRQVWREVTVTVEGSPRDYRISLDHVVKTQVAYRGNRNELRFPARLLCCPLKIAPDPGQEVLLRLNKCLSLKHRDTPIKERARQVIFGGLSRGHISQDQVASALAISSRTLRRKLAAENSSFQALLDECRMRAAALEFRIQPNQSLSGMALKLGYSEHSTFTRAFMRWSGMAPQEFRQTNSMAAAF